MVRKRVSGGDRNQATLCLNGGGGEGGGRVLQFVLEPNTRGVGRGGGSPLGEGGGVSRLFAWHILPFVPLFSAVHLRTHKRGFTVSAVPHRRRFWGSGCGGGGGLHLHKTQTPPVALNPPATHVKVTAISMGQHEAGTETGSDLSKARQQSPMAVHSLSYYLPPLVENKPPVGE